MIEIFRPFLPLPFFTREAGLLDSSTCCGLKGLWSPASCWEDWLKWSNVNFRSIGHLASRPNSCLAFFFRRKSPLPFFWETKGVSWSCSHMKGLIWIASSLSSSVSTFYLTLLAWWTRWQRKSLWTVPKTYCHGSYLEQVVSRRGLVSLVILKVLLQHRVVSDLQVSFELPHCRSFRRLTPHIKGPGRAWYHCWREASFRPLGAVSKTLDLKKLTHSRFLQWRKTVLKMLSEPSMEVLLRSKAAGELLGL